MKRREEGGKCWVSIGVLGWRLWFGGWELGGVEWSGGGEEL